jgi:hypothetical protein
LAGVTQPAGDAVAVRGGALGASVGATQLFGGGAAAVALVGVDCNLANSRDEATPSTGKPLACSKLEMAERVRLPA